jgi:hypothetical protein
MEKAEIKEQQVVALSSEVSAVQVELVHWCHSSKRGRI